MSPAHAACQRAQRHGPEYFSIAMGRSLSITDTWGHSTASSSSTEPESIARFNASKVPVAVLTNQAGVARGLYGIGDVARVHGYIAERLADYGAHIDLFLYCPYHPAGVVEAFARSSEDRKPRPGMAMAAQAMLNLDLAASWVVGDRPEDLGLAEAIGASAVYLGPDQIDGRDLADRRRIWRFASLAAAASFILEHIAA